MFEIIPFTNTRKNRSAAEYNPFSLFDEFERSFWNMPEVAQLKTDIYDNGDSYELTADLPGFKKEDIKIDLDNDCMTIKAERHQEAQEKDKKNNYLRVERSYGSFSRSFDVSEVKTDEITASYENGVLKLNLPKLDKKIETSKRIEIQ